MKKFDVFISHSSATKDIATHFYYNLISNGRDVWFDAAELEAGVPLEAEIRRGVQNSNTYLLLHSREAAQSEFVKIELDEAIRQRQLGNLRIIVVALDNSEIPAKLNGDLWLSPTNGDLLSVFETVMEQLSGHKSLLALTKSAFFGVEHYEKDVFGNKTWDLVLRHQLLLVGQIKSLLHNPGQTTDEKLSTLDTLGKISIFRDLPFSQNVRTALGDGRFEYVFPTRMRIIPKITVVGLPENYRLDVEESTEIHLIVRVTAKSDGKPHNAPVPFILELTSEI